MPSMLCRMVVSKLWAHAALDIACAVVQTALKEAYKLFTGGKFADALAAFSAMLEMIPLTVAETRRQADEVKELLGICREYHTGLRCEIERRKARPPCLVSRDTHLPTALQWCTQNSARFRISRQLQRILYPYMMSCGAAVVLPFHGTEGS